LRGKSTGFVLTYGTFDLFHIGHLELLRRLRQLGTELYVGVSTDEFNDMKGKKCITPFQDRLEIVRAIRYVSHAFPEMNWDQKRDDIERYSISTFAMGDDWIGKFDDLQDVCNVVYLPRTPLISTTDIKNRVRGIDDDLRLKLVEILGIAYKK